MQEIHGSVVDPAGNPLPGVCVSDGDAIIRTDAQGHFSLTMDPALHRFVAVHTPAGYEPVGDFFQRIDPDAPPAGPIRFVLREAPVRATDRPFTMIQATDIHVTTDGSRTDAEVFATQLQQAVDQVGADFVIISGDVTNSGTHAELAAYRQAIQRCSRPVMTLFGGHDGLEERRADPEATRPHTLNFQQIVGPTHFSFDWGDWHFILWPNEHAFFGRDGGAVLERWLEADLALQPPGRPVAVITHTDVVGDILAAAAGRRVEMILFGHFHSSRVERVGQTLVAATPPLCFGGIDQRPREFRSLRFEGDRFEMVLEHPRVARPVGRPVRGPASGGASGGASEPPILWTRAFPSPFHRSGVVCAGDALLMALGDEDAARHQAIVCLDAATGAERWRVPTDTSIKGGLAVAGGLCVGTSVAGRMYAIEIASGRIRWGTTLPSAHADATGLPWLYMATTADTTAAYTGWARGLTAVDLQTGSVRWNAPLERVIRWPSHAGVTLAGDVVAALLTRRMLAGFSAETGQMLWNVPFASEFHNPRPVVAGKYLVAMGAPGHLIVLEAQTGSVCWNEPVLGDGAAATALGILAAGEAGGDDSLIIVATTAGEIAAHELASGARRWQVPLGEDLMPMLANAYVSRTAWAPPLCIDGQVMIGSGDGRVRILDADGELLRTIALAAPVAGPMAAMAGTLYAGAYDGALYALDLGVKG